MGKQINFYMDRVDEEEFLRYLFSVYSLVVVVGEKQTNDEFPQFDLLDDLKSFEDLNRYYRFYLLNRDISDKLNVRFYPTSGCYFARGENSLSIQFNRCKIEDIEVREGRLYIDTDGWKFYGLDNKKIKQITKWYDSLVHWIKKRYKKIPNDWRYVGPHTLEAYKQGKTKLLENAPGVYIRMDIGESGQTYSRIEDEIDEKKYIDKI